MSKIRVLIVDDSFFMRKAISTILTDEEIEIIGSAQNGREGVEKARELKPDVITMDVEMPEMNGLEALKVIMDTNPTPVIMISTLTMEGAEATIEALSSGAIDFITKKPAFRDMDSMRQEILAKVKEIGRNSNLRNRINRNKLLQRMTSSEIDARIEENSKLYKLRPGTKPKKESIKAVNIGISTGGPEALKHVIPLIPGNFPVPIFIEQHMPPGFTKSLADRLDRSSELKVKEASDNDIPEPGNVYFAPGGKQMVMTKRQRIIVTDNPADSLYKPSVEVTMNSLLESYNNQVVGVMMTGMGSDGSVSYTKLSSSGGYIISQDVDTCVVAGMVKAVISANAANEIQPLDNIANALCSLFGLNALKPV